MNTIVSKETFNKACSMMNKRKHSPSATKAKELYLLQGLIRCGECGSGYEGNRRLAKDKAPYISYRCGARHRNKTCDNKEIKRETIEVFVLLELEKKILNDGAIQKITEKINCYLEDKHKNESVELKEMQTTLVKVESKIKNIIEAISNGFYQNEFKDEMERLKSEKIELETSIETLRINSESPKLTEDHIRQLFKDFKKFVIERNLPVCG